MRPADDIEALEQMSTIFGTDPLRDLAKKHGLCLLTDLTYTGVDLIKFTKAVRDGKLGFLKTLKFNNSYLLSNSTKKARVVFLCKCFIIEGVLRYFGL